MELHVEQKRWQSNGTAGAWAVGLQGLGIVINLVTLQVFGVVVGAIILVYIVSKADLYK
jgi:hypothetical protein